MSEAVFVFGASGHAKVVVDVLEREGRFRPVALFDDGEALWGTQVYGLPVIGGKEALLERQSEYAGGIVAIGVNGAREKVASVLVAQGHRLVAAVHPSAQLGRGVCLGLGTVIMACVAVNSDSVIGENVIVNTGATVDHDCRIGNGVHIAPGCNLCGNVTVGDRSFLGVGTVVIPGVTIGKDVVVGAGSTVIRDLPDGVRVVGSPTHAISRA